MLVLIGNFYFPIDFIVNDTTSVTNTLTDTSYPWTTILGLS